MESVGQLIPERLNDVNSLRQSIEKQRESVKNDSNLSAPSKLVLSTMFSSMTTFFEDLDAVQKEQSGDGEGQGGPGFQLAEIESFDAFSKKGRILELDLQGLVDPSLVSSGIVLPRVRFFQRNAMILRKQKSLGQTAYLGGLDGKVGNGSIGHPAAIVCHQSHDVGI